MSAFTPGQIAWIIESAYRVREVYILKISGNLAAVRFTDVETGGIRIPVSRLYADRKEAERDLQKKPKC